VAQDATNRVRQLLADSNFYQKKFQKKETKLAYTLQVLNTKEKELQDMLTSNRRLNDLSTSMLTPSRFNTPSLSRSFADDGGFAAGYVQCSRRISMKPRRRAFLSIKL
jgi:hypothetical protein